jgi:hypothetical protein
MRTYLHSFGLNISTMKTAWQQFKPFSGEEVSLAMPPVDQFVRGDISFCVGFRSKFQAAITLNIADESTVHEKLSGKTERSFQPDGGTYERKAGFGLGREF